MNAMARLLIGTNRQRVVGKGVGILVGSLGILVAVGVLFVPLSYEVGPGVTEHMPGFEYLFGNPTAEQIFHRAMLVLLISISILYMVTTGGIRTLWLTTGIIGIAGMGGLQYGNAGKILLTVAVMLALSSALLTVSHDHEGKFLNG